MLRPGIAFLLLVATSFAQDQDDISKAINDAMKAMEEGRKALDDLQKSVDELEKRHQEAEARAKREAAICEETIREDGAQRMVAQIGRDDDVPFAVEVLMRIGPPAIPDLIDGLALDPRKARDTLALVLALQKTPTPVVDALGDPRPLVRIGACRTLVLMRFQQAREPVVALTSSDTDPGVRFWAAWAAEELGAVVPDAIFANALSTTDWERRAWAVRRLIASPAVLLDHLGQVGPEVQQEIADALRPHAEKLLPRYEELLGSQDAGVRRGVVYALAAVHAAHGTGIRGRAQRREEYAEKAAETEQAIGRALAYLREQQRPNGSWRAVNPDHTVGVTALAVLALLGTGRSDQNVEAGLDYLAGVQNEDGSLGEWILQSSAYGQALGTIALCEGAYMVPYPRYRRAAARAVNRVVASRLRDGGWSYGSEEQPGTTVLTAWMMLALEVGRRAGLDVEPVDPSRYLDRRLDCDAYGVWWVGYSKRGEYANRPEALRQKFPGQLGRANEAAGMLMYLVAGKRGIEKEGVLKLSKRCLDQEPQWGSEVPTLDMPAWYFTSMMAAALSSRDSRKWHRKLDPAILRGQEERGWWSSAGPWAPRDHIYATSMMVLCLQSPYLYDWETKPHPTVKAADKLLRRARKDADPTVADLAAKSLAR